MMAAHAGEASAAALRRRLDQAVAVARAVRVLGWLGRVACVAAVAAMAVALIENTTTARLPAAGLVVGVVTAVGAIVAWLWSAGPVPRRLDVAAATEAASPQLGERLSRAVDFLSDHAAAAESRGLEDLAIAEASAAVAAGGRLAIPGLDRHRWWLVAGGVAAIGLVMMRPWLPHAPSTIDTQPAAIPAEDGAHDAAIAEAAASIAACAAIESRLTDMLDTRFVKRPGVPRDQLPTGEQGDLDRLAAIHADVIREIARSQDALEPLVAAVPAARAAVDCLDTIDPATLDAATTAISLHRLASASTTTARVSEALSAAARALGRKADGGDGDDLWQLAAMPPPVRRLAAALAEIDLRPSGTGSAPEAAVSSLPSQPAPAGQAGPAAAPRETGPAPRDRGPDGSATVTTEPRFGPGAESPAAVRLDQRDVHDARDQPAGPVSRVWGLLPARVRPGDGRGTEPEVPAAYRQAVDLYYKSLLDSLPPP